MNKTDKTSCLPYGACIPEDVESGDKQQARHTNVNHTARVSVTPLETAISQKVGSAPAKGRGRGWAAGGRVPSKPVAPREASYRELRRMLRPWVSAPTPKSPGYEAQMR